MSTSNRTLLISALLLVLPTLTACGVTGERDTRVSGFLFHATADFDIAKNTATITFEGSQEGLRGSLVSAVAFARNQLASDRTRIAASPTGPQVKLTADEDGNLSGTLSLTDLQDKIALLVVMDRQDPERTIRWRHTFIVPGKDMVHTMPMRRVQSQPSSRVSQPR